MDFDDEVMLPKAHEGLSFLIKTLIRPQYRDVFVKDLILYLQLNNLKIEACFQNHDEHLRWSDTFHSSLSRNEYYLLEVLGEGDNTGYIQFRELEHPVYSINLNALVSAVPELDPAKQPKKSIGDVHEIVVESINQSP